MQRCWEYEPEDRPSFAHCLQCLQQTQVAALGQAPGLVQAGMTVHNAQYARTPGEYGVLRATVRTAWQLRTVRTDDTDAVTE